MNISVETHHPPARRTQAERTAQTRRALIDAAITVLSREGYGAASTALIAEQAGVSRGAILHHFGTRAHLMADVLRAVYDREHAAHAEAEARTGRGSQIADWPDMLWETLGQPSGRAALEILQATRSDPDLAKLVGPIQLGIERDSVQVMAQRFGASQESTLALIRLLVWAVRGLSIAQGLARDSGEIARSIAMFRRILAGAAEAGALPRRAGDSPDADQD